MSRPWMSDGDIVMMYRQAKNPNAEIGVLADLNCVSKEAIREILSRHGVLVKKKKKAKTARMPRWTAAQDAILTDMLSEGASYAEIGDKIGRSKYAVKSRLYTLGLNPKKYRKG